MSTSDGHAEALKNFIRVGCTQHIHMMTRGASSELHHYDGLYQRMA